MQQFKKIGNTGRKLVAEGLVGMAAGMLLVLFDTWLPSVAIHWFLLSVIVLGVVDIVSRFFKKVPSQDSMVVVILRVVISIWLFGNALVTEIPIWIVVILMGAYEVFMAFISGVTYYIYVKDGIRPRKRFLRDTLWNSLIGFSALSSASTETNLQMVILGVYLIRWGYTNIRDGLFFESEVGKHVLRRRVRVGMPLVVAALIPRATLQKINQFLQDNEGATATEIFNQTKKEAIVPDVEVFIHVTEDGFGAIGHVDLCYQGRMISYGNYDTNSERFFGMVGDGVLFETDREKYIEFCKKESHKTLLGYGLSLTEEQLEKVDAQIQLLRSQTTPWMPSPIVKPKKPTEKEEPMYAYKLMQETDASLYKFTTSKFKTYFVLSTNCVLLADSIIGTAGTDILSVQGFIAPGTYQEYLEKEFQKPNSLVVTKRVYQ